VTHGSYVVQRRAQSLSLYVLVRGVGEERRVEPDEGLGSVAEAKARLYRAKIAKEV
jgi:hypothetical protein